MTVPAHSDSIVNRKHIDLIMAREILTLTLGPVQTNAYIIGDTETRRAVLIDPVDNPTVIVEAIEERGWELALVLATHAHFDHVLASKSIVDLTGAPFWVHRDCVEWLQRLPEQGLRFGLEMFPPAAMPDKVLGDEPEAVVVDSIRLDSLYTPGHAPGHLSFFMADDNVLFSGDTLFRSGIGRVDLPGGDYNVLMRSIFRQLLPLGDEVRVLSGHGPETTIGREKKTNPFLLSYADTDA